MLIAPSTTRVDNRRRLAKASRQAEIPVRLHVVGAELSMSTMSWSAYWKPVQEYVEYDRRLVHRLVQLKKSWRSLLRLPTNVIHQQIHCIRDHSACMQRNPDERGRPSEHRNRTRE